MLNEGRNFLIPFHSPSISSLQHSQLLDIRLKKSHCQRRLTTLATQTLQAAGFPGEQSPKPSSKMPSSAHLTFVSLLALSPLAALARTDFSGCTSFTSTVTINPTAHEYGNVYGSVVYYDPDTLEICTVPDCGGGRAPPKTGVPGCPLYSGTATVTPSFLSADPLAATMTTSSGAAQTTTATTSSSGTDESSSSASSTSVIVVTGTDGSANATGGPGTAQATRSSTVVGGSSTGSATGAPSASADSSSGAASRVAIGGLSGALGLVVALLF